MACHPSNVQFYGEGYGGMDCALTVNRDMIELHHGCVQPSGIRGAWPATGYRQRQYLNDFSQGTNLGQVDWVGRNYYRMDPVVEYRRSLTGLWDWVRAGYFVHLNIGYGPILRPYRGQETFTGNHSVGIHGPFRSSPAGYTVCMHDPLYDGRRAGIPSAPQWVPTSMLARAAGALRLGSYTLGSRYPGTCYAARSPLAPFALLPDTSTTGGSVVEFATANLTGYVLEVPKGTQLYRLSGRPWRTKTAAFSRRPNVRKADGRSGRYVVQYAMSEPYPDGKARPTDVLVLTGRLVKA